MIEVNPRASRTVPFASKATGVNLVDAAVRLAAGARLHELELPTSAARARQCQGRGAPVRPLPRPDPVLGPEMRSTGEVMASAADLPTAFAKAERAAGRPLPNAGAAFLSVRDADKVAIGPIAGALAALGFELLATGGAAAVLAGLDVTVLEGRRGRRRDPTGRCDLVVNTPQGSGARRDDGSARRRSLRASPASTLAEAASPSTRLRTRARRSRTRCRSGSSVRRELRSVRGAERVGPYTLLRIDEGGSTRASRASSSCSRRPGECCRGR